MKKLILLSTAIFVLSGCGIYNKYKPVSEVPGNLYGSDSIAAIDTTNFGNLSWREVFTDPLLQALIDSALTNNTDMQTAQLRVKEAEASLMTSKLSYLPSLFLSPEGTVSSIERGKAAQTYSLPVSASWELDVFGKLTNAKRKAKAAYLESQEYVQAVKTQLVASVANTYYTLLMLDAQYEIAIATQTAWEKSVKTSRSMKKAGMLNEAGLAQTEATYYNISTTVLDLKEQINQTENALSLLLATVPQQTKRGRLENQQLPENFSIGVPMQMLSNRPDVRRAELSLEQAFYSTNAARAAFYPSITLSGSAGWVNNAGGIIMNPAQFVASAVASLTQPLFNKGANVAQLKIAKARQEEARLSFEQTLLSAGSEVNDALMKYQTAHKKADLYERQIASLQTAVKSTSLLMKHGDTTYLEVLTAQQTLLSARLTQVSNRFTKIQGVIHLYKALGGGRI